MVILQIHNYYQKSGGEDTVVKAEMDLLVKMGHTVFTLNASNDDVKDYYKTKKKFYTSFKTILKLNIIEIAHIHNTYQIIGNDIYKHLFDAGIPIVQTLHNYRFLCPAGLHLDNKNIICEKCKDGNFIYCTLKKCYQDSYAKSFLMQSRVKTGRNIVLKYVDRFIALNIFCKNKFISSGFPENKISIKSNFIFENQAQENNKIGGYALYIGRISAEKGVEMLVETFKDLKYKLKILGTGESRYVSSLKLKALGYTNIEFLGFHNGKEKDELMSQASFLVVPSIWYETFGLVVLEAYSHSKPVIASDIGGLTSIVKNGVTGFLFKPGDNKSLRGAVDMMLQNNKFIQLGMNANKYFSENFTEKQNYEQLMDIYQSAIEERARKNEKTTY